MKEPKISDIRARINTELKQEFSDVFGDMSKKLIGLIEESLENEKNKYLAGIVSICEDNNENIEVFQKILDYILNILSSENGPLLADNYESMKIINQMSEDVLKQYGKEGKEIFFLIYRDLINGLYKGSEKDTLEQRVNRLYRNKSNVISFIVKKIYNEKF